MLGVILYGVFGTVLGEDLVGVALVRTAAVVALLNAMAAPIVMKATEWAIGSGRGARARGVFR